jgi:uncharacterized protein YecE (DUF72 family)
MGLHIGTSGWAYKEWRPGFYPAELPQKRFLDHYAATLSACEINATFYRVPSDAAVARWATAAPDGFRYALKAHVVLTHSYSGPPEDLSHRFSSAAQNLGPRLGVVLFQLPAHRERDDAGAATLLKLLPRGVPGAFEPAHESWHAPEVDAMLAEAGATRCYTDTSGDPPAELPPGPVGYVRLRAERYDEGARAAWSALLRREAEARDVYAFTKHKGVAPEDPAGGVGLALWLQRAGTGL